MPDIALYLFDGSNLFHAGGFGHRDGSSTTSRALSRYAAPAASSSSTAWGRPARSAPSTVRFAPDADSVLERLAAERRHHETVLLVTSDAAVQGTSGQEVRKRSSAEFLADLAAVTHREHTPSRLGDRVDAETRARLERLRRGER